MEKKENVKVACVERNASRYHLLKEYGLPASIRIEKFVNDDGKPVKYLLFLDDSNEYVCFTSQVSLTDYLVCNFDF